MRIWQETDHRSSTPEFSPNPPSVYWTSVIFDNIADGTDSLYWSLRLDQIGNFSRDSNWENQIRKSEVLHPGM